jgi:hypothetical protein
MRLVVEGKHLGEASRETHPTSAANTKLSVVNAKPSVAKPSSRWPTPSSRWQTAPMTAALVLP